jgi:hypothetical protein
MEEETMEMMWEGRERIAAIGNNGHLFWVDIGVDVAAARYMPHPPLRGLRPQGLRQMCEKSHQDTTRWTQS